MKMEKLPEKLRKTIRCLANGSISIQADVMEALGDAEDLKDFEDRIIGAMNRLTEEINDILREVKHRKLTEKERDRMIDVYASGPMTYIPEIDDPLMLLGLLQYYDTSSPTLAVEAKYSENVFYAQNGTVKTEWYGEKTEDEVPETPIEMDEFRETAANVINEVTEAIQTEYPELQPKKEFLEECENAAVLYGESYYNLESRIEDMLRRQFISKNPEIVEVIP